MQCQIEFSDKELILAKRVMVARVNSAHFIYCDEELARIIRNEEICVNADGYHLMPASIAERYLINKLATAI